MTRQVMPKINSKAFRCDCGANVFTEVEPLRYKCNGCGARWIGEKDWGVTDKKIKHDIESIPVQWLDEAALAPMGWHVSTTHTHTRDATISWGEPFKCPLLGHMYEANIDINDDGVRCTYIHDDLPTNRKILAHQAIATILTVLAPDIPPPSALTKAKP